MAYLRVESRTTSTELLYPLIDFPAAVDLVAVDSEAATWAVDSEVDVSVVD